MSASMDNNVDLETYFQNISAEEFAQYNFLDDAELPSLQNQPLDSQLSQSDPTSSSPLQSSSERYSSPPLLVPITSDPIQGHRPTQGNITFNTPTPPMPRALLSSGGSRGIPAPLPRQPGAKYYYQPAPTWVRGPAAAAPLMIAAQQAYGKFTQPYAFQYVPQQQPAAHPFPPNHLPPQVPQHVYQHQPVNAQSLNHLLSTGAFTTTEPLVRGLDQPPPSNPFLRRQTSQVAPPQASAGMPNQGHSMLYQHQSPSVQGQNYSGKVNQGNPMLGQYQQPPGVAQNMPNQGFGMSSQHPYSSALAQNNFGLSRQYYPLLGQHLKPSAFAQNSFQERAVQSSVLLRNSPVVYSPAINPGVNTQGQHIFNQPSQPFDPVQNSQHRQQVPQPSPQNAVPNMQPTDMFGNQFGQARPVKTPRHQQRRAKVGTPSKDTNSVYRFPPVLGSERRFNGPSVELRQVQIEANAMARSFQESATSATPKKQTRKKRKVDSIEIPQQKESSILEQPQLPQGPDCEHPIKRCRRAGPSLSQNGQIFKDLEESARHVGNYDVSPLKESSYIELDEDESTTPNFPSAVLSGSSPTPTIAAVPTPQMAPEQVQNIAPHEPSAQNGIQPHTQIPNPPRRAQPGFVSTHDYILWDFIKNLDSKSTGPFATQIYVMSEDNYPRTIEYIANRDGGFNLMRGRPAKNRAHIVTSAAHRIKMPDGKIDEAFCTVYTRNYEKGFLGMQLNSEGKLVEIQQPEIGYTLFGEKYKGMKPREYMAAVACNDSNNKEHSVEVRVMPLKRELDGIWFDVEPDWDAVVVALKEEVSRLETEVAHRVLASLPPDKRERVLRRNAAENAKDEYRMPPTPTVQNQRFPHNAGSRSPSQVAPQQRVQPGSIRYTPQTTLPHGNVAQRQSSGGIQPVNPGYTQQVPSSHVNSAYSSLYSGPYMQPGSLGMVNGNKANVSRPAPVQHQVSLEQPEKEKPAAMRANGVEEPAPGDRQQFAEKESVSEKRTAPTPAVKRFPQNPSPSRSVGVGLTLPSAPPTQKPVNNSAGPSMINGLYMPTAPSTNGQDMQQQQCVDDPRYGSMQSGASCIGPQITTLQLSPGNIHTAREYVKSVINTRVSPETVRKRLQEVESEKLNISSPNAEQIPHNSDSPSTVQETNEEVNSSSEGLGGDYTAELDFELFGEPIEEIAEQEVEDPNLRRIVGEVLHDGREGDN